MNPTDSIMASRYFKKCRNPFAKKSALLHQKMLIERHYDFLKVLVEDGILICQGVVRSVDFKNVYKIEIRCVCGFEPYSKIIEPVDIEPNLKIHMYNDHSLCLHYGPDMDWNACTPIYKYTVPWVIEWILYYELYLINGGKWEGKESPAHFSEAEKNISHDFSDEQYKR